MHSSLPYQTTHRRYRCLRSQRVIALSTPHAPCRRPNFAPVASLCSPHPLPLCKSAHTRCPTRWGEESLRHVVHGCLGARWWNNTCWAASWEKSRHQLQHQYGHHHRSSTICAPPLARSQLTHALLHPIGTSCACVWGWFCRKFQQVERDQEVHALEHPRQGLWRGRGVHSPYRCMRHLPRWVHRWRESVRAPSLSTSGASHLALLARHLPHPPQRDNVGISYMTKQRRHKRGNG
jgi:hypothetical protein